MPEPRSRLPLALTAMLQKIHVPGGAAPAAGTLGRIPVWRHVIQDFRPVAECLEWRLADLLWARDGIQPFIDSGVPYLVNNTGRLSADAAAVLFANCSEAAGAGEPIRVLEFGAGTGLFARYFLDEFRLLCQRSAADYYERLTYVVTDRSPRTVEQWNERGVFQGHASKVTARTLDATNPADAGPVRAVFCNYVLDVLPLAFLRKTAAGWEQLCVRTALADNPEVLRQYTGLTFDEIGPLADSSDAEQLERLLPLLPVLEWEAEFRPATLDPPGLEDAPDGATVVYNFGAFACLESFQRQLAPDGFVLINDYGSPLGEAPATCAPGQRFGPIVAAGLNFPLLEDRCRHAGLDTLAAEGDEALTLHARLLVRAELAATRRAFQDRFRAAAQEQSESPARWARQYAGQGQLRDALACFRDALERNPRNWQLMGEAAVFVMSQLGDLPAALELARDAVELNPWYSPALWNVLGDCLGLLGRPQDAHECYLQACRIHPDDVETNLKLADSWLALGDPSQSLHAVACGLANDSMSMYRHVLLEKQQRAIASLAERWNAERATAARRTG